MSGYDPNDPIFGQMQGSSGAPGSGMAINPKTGKLEQVYATYETLEGGQQAETRRYFESDPDRPTNAQSMAGYAPGYYSDNGSTDQLLKENMVLGGLGAIAGGGALGLDAAAVAPGAVAPTGGLGGVLSGATGDATLIGGDAADAYMTGGISGAGNTAAATTAAGTGTLDAVNTALGGVGEVGAGFGTGNGILGTLGGAGAVTGAAAGGTAASRLVDYLTGKEGATTPSTADLLQVLGTLGSTGLGIIGSQQQADALQKIYDDMAAKRQPFLDQANAWRTDPSSYINGPGQAALQGVLRGLSVNGNPFGSGTSLGIATDAGLRNWQNAVTGFGNLGLAGEDTRANVATNAANAVSNVYNAIGSGIYDLTQPKKKTLGDYLGGLV